MFEMLNFPKSVVSFFYNVGYAYDSILLKLIHLDTKIKRYQSKYFIQTGILSKLQRHCSINQG